MTTAKQRITPKKKVPTKKVEPRVDVKVEPPVVNIEPPVIDMSNLNAAIEQMIAHQNKVNLQLTSLLREHSRQMNEVLAENSRILQQLAKRKPAARPDDFYVEFDKDGNDTVGMRIRGRKSH